MSEFSNVNVQKEANIYFGGKVISTSISFQDGSKKTLGVMLKGEYEFGFAVDWMRKDLGIAKEEASRNGVAMPLVDMVDSFYEEVQGMGGGRWDTSSLLTRYTRR